MKKTIETSFKIIAIVFILITIFCFFSNKYVCAASDGKFNPDDYKVDTSLDGDTKIKEIGNKIIGPVSLIGSLVSVMAIIIIGIKYMLGSVEEKAQYKETLGPYFIGAVLVFGIITVLSIVRTIASSL